MITIHHHHHKPKKEHHHHHHHHPKPHIIPSGHHYHHHKKAHTTTKTESKGHGHHGHHGHHHKSHGHHHGHHHHDTPSYDPPRIPSYEDDYSPSYSPAVPSYGGGIGHHIPQVRGVTHTVKQVKVFDTLPGAIPHGGNHGYEVTEHGDDEDEDVFTSVNGLQQSYPATYSYTRGAAEQPSQDPFAELSGQSAVQTNNHDPFAGAFPQPTVSLSGGQHFPGSTQHNPFAAAEPTQNTGLAIQPSDFPAGFDEQPTSFAGNGGDNSVFLSNDENTINDTPVSFSREAGIQQITKTDGIESFVY